MPIWNPPGLPWMGMWTRQIRCWRFPRWPCAAAALPPPCADGPDADADAGGETINASSPGAPPTVDDGTADASWPNQNWGTAADYQNEPAYGVPYAAYPSRITVAVGTMN